MRFAEPGEREIELTLRMSMLLDAIRAMHELDTSSNLRTVFADHVLNLVRELVPADNGVVLLGDEIGEATQFNAGVLKRLREERAAFVSQTSTGSSVTVPLLVRNEIAGLVHLTRNGPLDAFGDPHLLALTAVARIASLALENAFQIEWLRSEVKRLEPGLDVNDQLAGDSEKMRELRARIALVAPRSTTVLIIGESGTGKELVARSLHRQSLRCDQPFVAINCAALTDTLLESELFGYEKGAFTGAGTQKRGRLETANGGSVFLDEIGEMPLTLQVKLLRVLQNREFQRVGGTQTMPLDIRLIAATNRDLDEAVRQGSFREDLFYRLNVVRLRTPALRERPEDIIALAQLFAIRFGEKFDRAITGISPTARAVLRSYDWPGNVRELENAVEHAVVLGSGETILAEDLPEALRNKHAEITPRETGMLQEAIDNAKRTVVKRAFELAAHDHAKAAHLLGVHPNYLYKLLRNLNMQPYVKAAAK